MKKVSWLWLSCRFQLSASSSYQLSNLNNQNLVIPTPSDARGEDGF